MSKHLRVSLLLLRPGNHKTHRSRVLQVSDRLCVLRPLMIAHVAGRIHDLVDKSGSLLDLALLCDGQSIRCRLMLQ